MYFVIQIQKLLDGSIANAIFNFSTLEDAQKNYHYFLSANIGSESLKYCMCAIIGLGGDTIIREAWYAPSPEPAPEPTPESDSEE